MSLCPLKIVRRLMYCQTLFFDTVNDVDYVAVLDRDCVAKLLPVLYIQALRDSVGRLRCVRL
jgi:hypothetical protein